MHVGIIFVVDMKTETKCFCLALVLFNFYRVYEPTLVFGLKSDYRLIWLEVIACLVDETGWCHSLNM